MSHAELVNLEASYRKYEAEFQKHQKEADKAKSLMEAYGRVIADLQSSGKKNEGSSLIDEDARIAQVNAILEKKGDVHASELASIWGRTVEGAGLWIKGKIDHPAAKWKQGTSNRHFVAKDLNRKLNDFSEPQ